MASDSESELILRLIIKLESLEIHSGTHEKCWSLQHKLGVDHWFTDISITLQLKTAELESIETLLDRAENLHR